MLTTTNVTVRRDLEHSLKVRRDGIQWDGTYGGLLVALSQMGLTLDSRISVEAGVSQHGGGWLVRDDDPHSGEISILEK